METVNELLYVCENVSFLFVPRREATEEANDDQKEREKVRADYLEPAFVCMRANVPREVRFCVTPVGAAIKRTGKRFLSL